MSYESKSVQQDSKSMQRKAVPPRVCSVAHLATDASRYRSVSALVVHETVFNSPEFVIISIGKLAPD